MFTPEQIERLSAPLDRSKVKTRSQAGQKLSYLEGWQVIEFANEVFGFDGWNRETVLLNESSRDLVNIKKQDYKTKEWKEYQQWRISYVCKVRITVGNVVREGTGFGSGMGKPEAIGDAIEGAIKEAETDAMKRALMTFGYGFGLALYDKTQSNVEDAKESNTAKSKGRQPDPAKVESVRKAAKESRPATIDSRQVAEFLATAEGNGWTEDGIKGLLEKAGFDSVESISPDRFSKALAALKNENTRQQYQ